MSEQGLKNGAAVKVVAEKRASGEVILRNALELADAVKTLPECLAHWADIRGDQLFLSELKTGTALTYGEAAQRRSALADRLLALDVSDKNPLMIVGENSINHALILLAANSVGLPVAVISPSYVRPNGEPWKKFSALVGKVVPGLIFADDVASVEAAVGDIVPVMPLRDLGRVDAVTPVPTKQRVIAERSVGRDSVAKLLFTSGSTGTPKAVIQTQGMMGSNMEGLAGVWPFLTQRPPVLVDWLPWNHVFGGNFCFNIALYFGGALHIDCGKPVAGAIDHTVKALRKISPTAYFNVPMGYEMLLPELEADRDLARQFFGGVDCLFNAGAAMHGSVRARLEKLALESSGKVPPIYGGWGSTETAPLSTIVYFPTPHASNLGVPLPGTSIKMVPDAGKWELRVKGPNVTLGYWGEPDATAAAFDDEGYFLIGDAGVLADPEDPSAGILFDGRVAENFKLSSGTWVNVDALRLAIISASDGLVGNAVIAGEGHDEIGVLLFLSETGAGAGRQAVREKLQAYNAGQTGSSVRVARFALCDVPPNAAKGEVTEKGSLNQRRILDLRADQVAQLFQTDTVFEV